LNDPPFFECGIRIADFGINTKKYIIKKQIDQSRRIFALRVIKRSFIGISSWDLSSIFLRTTLPFSNSSSPRIRTYRAFNLSARLIWLFRLFPS